MRVVNSACVRASPLYEEQRGVLGAVAVVVVLLAQPRTPAAGHRHGRPKRPGALHAVPRAAALAPPDRLGLALDAHPAPGLQQTEPRSRGTPAGTRRRRVVHAEEHARAGRGLIVHHVGPLPGVVCAPCVVIWQQLGHFSYALAQLVRVAVAALALAQVGTLGSTVVRRHRHLATALAAAHAARAAARRPGAPAQHRAVRGCAGAHAPIVLAAVASGCARRVAVAASPTLPVAKAVGVPLGATARDPAPGTTGG